MCSIIGVGERLQKVLRQIGSKRWFPWQQKSPTYLYWGKWCLQLFSVVFDLILFISTDNVVKYKISNEIFTCCGWKFAAGGCELSTTTHVKTAWKKFKERLPVLSSPHLSFKTHDHMYSSCVWSAMLHASETWPLTKPNLQRLQRNDMAMIRQICNVRPQDVVTPGPMSYLRGLPLRIWTSFWRREGSAGMDMWNALWCS